MTEEQRMTQRLLVQLLDEVREINQKLARTESQSSVQLSTSTRGTDVTVKAYPDSPVVQAGDAALSEYVRLRREIEVQQMDSWAATVDQVKRRA